MTAPKFKKGDHVRLTDGRDAGKTSKVKYESRGGVSLEDRLGGYWNWNEGDLEKVPQVGCENADGTLNIHLESETCAVCAPQSIAPLMPYEEYTRALGRSVCEMATGFGWKRGDPEDALTFVLRKAREVAIEDALNIEAKPENEQRLAQVLSEGLGARHPAMDDLAALIFSARRGRLQTKEKK